MRKKVAIIGAGNVGATTALFVVNSGLADVVLYDIVEGMPQGKALDILQNTAVTGVKSDISGTNSLDDLAGSDIVVITAGLARKPGMRRKDLLMANTEIVGGIVKQIADICPQAIYIVVTNPMDVMAYVTLAVSGVNRQRVLGMGGVLDSSRFKTFISIELKVSPRDIETLVLGGHGLYMVPLIRYTTVKGIPISKWLSKEKIEALVQRTREGGAEIVSLLKTGSAYYAPAQSTFEMVKSIILDEKRVLPCSVYLDGEYGTNDVFNGVPVVLGKQGLEKIVELELTEEEMQAFKNSTEEVKEMIKILKEEGKI
ncbi:malate dehydrogenase [Thermodesulfovibrio thiophilus]|uniref:malate dehydrogenase n=1 Tax=Thermodesulfovibrio thiophilus TaxID=340095 RepID=UPI00181AA02A|nr:malate dehydrogenase [Thermodesulfovibrio thiophilus]HHW20179.1 malate dehydrogenase [Thermodesulfovibrio thiophilus]